MKVYMNNRTVFNNCMHGMYYSEISRYLLWFPKFDIVLCVFLLVPAPFLTVFLTGTGKSETGAHLAYAFARLNKVKHPRRCVLYCGPSNKAVNVVLGKQQHQKA